MKWKLMGVTAVINAVITILLIIIYLPLSIIGPLIGGFLTSYLSNGYEDYEVMDLKDGAVLGAFSGLFGGLILTVLFMIFGSLNPFLEVFIGSNTLVLGYAILQITVISSFILGLVGGVIGVLCKN